MHIQKDFPIFLLFLFLSLSFAFAFCILMMKQFSLHFGIAVVGAFFLSVCMSVSFNKQVAILLFISNGSNIAILFVRNEVAKNYAHHFVW